jgi:replication-associated protein G2P
MIDWLNIEVPLKHRPIEQGRRLVIDHEGEVTSEFVQFRGVERTFDDEGSYTSKVAVSSISNAYTDEVVGVFDVEMGMASGISIRGNPCKYLQGHNIFGVSCIKTLAFGVVADVLPKLGFSDFEVSQALRAVEQGAYRVTKIDITKMFDLGSDQAVREYLQMMPHVVSARGDRCEFCKNTFYVGKHSGLWSLKMYNKYLEITSKSKAHRLPDFLPKEDFERFALGKVRVELVLQKQILNRLDLMNPILLQEKIDELFDEFTGRIQMKNQVISELDYLELGATYQATVANWRAGKNLKSMMKREAFYRHRRKLLPLGIDISKPPIRVEDRVAIVYPMKTLMPKEVVDIPKDLQRYLLKVA